jgi:hypothetical protein
MRTTTTTRQPMRRAIERLRRQAVEATAAGFPELALRPAVEDRLLAAEGKREDEETRSVASLSPSARCGAPTPSPMPACRASSSRAPSSVW